MFTYYTRRRNSFSRPSRNNQEYQLSSPPKLMTLPREDGAREARTLLLCCYSMVSSPSFDASWFGDKLLPKHEPLRNRWDRRSLCRRIDGRTNGEKGRQRPKAPSFSASRFPAFARPLARARSPAPNPSRASLASTRAVSHRARAVAKPDLETQQQSRTKSKIWNLSF